MSPRHLVGPALLALLLLLPTSALAGKPGRWTLITIPHATPLGEVSLARTADGTLHAAWIRADPADPTGTDLLQTPISPAGAVGSPVTIASDWSALNNPALLASAGGGLEALTGGIRTLEPSEAHTHLALFSSSDGGASWSLFPEDLVNSGAVYASDVGAALGAGGVPFVAWGSTYCLCVHRGTSPTAPSFDYQEGLGDFGYEPSIAVDQHNGRMVVAWYSNATGHSGVYTAAINQATGERDGTTARMPGTGNITDGPLGGHTPIAARAGGGLFLAYPGGYPSHTKVLLWRVGSTRSAQLARIADGVRSVGVASAPDGRMWAYWASSPGNRGLTIYARRSNRKASRWGATVAMKPPKHAQTSWNLVGSGQRRLLDLVGSFTIGDASYPTSWHTQVRPGLSLRAAAGHGHLRKGRTATLAIKVRVTDAGEPVRGAAVQAGHAHARTNRKGRTKLTIRVAGRKARLRIRARKHGYVAATETLRVR